MSGDSRPAPCPSCGKPVSARPSTCPHCGLTFLSVCSCGSTWHLLTPRCPACGRGHRIRKKESRRFWKSRRFRLAVVAVALLVLVAVNLVFIVAQSPERRKYHAYQDGLEAYERGRFDEAAIRFREYLEIEPESAEAKYMLGLALFQDGDEDEAVRMLEAATRISNSFHLAHIALSEHYLRRGMLREALARGRIATENEPTPATAWVALADALVAVGDTTEAIQAFKRALELDGRLVESQLKLADLYLTRKYLGLDSMGEGLATERYGRAEESARRLLAADPTNVRARIWLAKARAGRGFLADAIDELEKVVEEEPDEPAHRLLLARFHEALGDFEAEDVILAEALDRTPTPDLAIQRAKVLAERIHDPDEARIVLERAIERDPEHVGLRIALVAHYRNRDRFEEAERALDLALAERPNDADLLMARGDLRLAAGDPDAAAEAWRRTIESRPGSVGARKRLVKLLLPGVVGALTRGDAAPPGLAEVEECIDWFLDPETGLNPADPDARDWAARLAFTRGDFDRAADLLGGARGADPDSWAGLRLLGVSWLNRDAPDYAQASRALYAALTHPDCPRTFEDFELAWLAAYRTGHYSREAEVAGMAVRNWPEDVDWRLRLATSLTRDGRLGPALAECGQARLRLSGTTDVRALLLMARIHRAAGDLPSARRSLEDAVGIRRDPETLGALYDFIAATGDEKLAEQGFRTLIDENPTDPVAFLRLGDFLLKRGDPDGALAQYLRAVALAPDSREAVYRLTELKMARASSDEAQLSAAQEALAALRDADPDDPYLDYFTGKVHLLKQEHDAAVVALGRYTRRNRNDAAGLYYLGIAYRRTDDLPKARDAFLAALGLDPGMTEAKLELATLYFTNGIRAHRAGDLDSARTEFERVMGLDTGEPETRRFLADTLAGLGFLDEAAIEAGAALELAPGDPAGLFLAGLIDSLRGDFEAAEARFRELTEAAPDNYRSHLHLAQALAEQREFAAARDALRPAWQLAPEGDDVLTTAVLIEIADGKPEEAIQILEAERLRTPDRSVVLHCLGNAYDALGRPRQAVASWLAAFEADAGDVAALHMAAAVTADEGDLAKAIQYLTEGEKRAPGNASLLALKGAMLQAIGEPERAEEAFREALVAEPANLPALRGLGLLLARSGREQEGGRLLERAVAEGLEHPGVRFRLARLAQARDETALAMEHYRAVLALTPDDAPTLNNLALLLSTTKEGIDEALALATRANEAGDADPRYQDTLGWVLYRAERFDEAAAVLLLAAKGLPEEAEVQFHAGMAAFRCYRWDEARPLLEKAFALDPEFEGAEEAKAALARMR